MIDSKTLYVCIYTTSCRNAVTGPATLRNL